MIGFVKRRWFFFVLITLLVVGGVIINNARKAKGQILTVEKTSLIETVSFSGYIDATEKSTMVFQTAGKLAFIKVKDGDVVKKGQLLAGLDTGELWAAERAAYYKYLAADANAKYVEDTVKDHDKDESYLQKNNRVAAQTDRDVKYDSWLTAQRQLRYATLYSPISGVVYGSNDVSAGDFITSINQVKFNIVNPETIYFSANADQTDVVRIQEGQEAELTLDSYPTRSFTAVVTRVSFAPRTDETGTVYEVKLALPKDIIDLVLRLGMTGDVNFITNELPDVIAIPSKYIKNSNGIKQIKKNVDGRVQSTEVTTGLTVDGMVEIISGLEPGDQVYDQTR